MTAVLLIPLVLQLLVPLLLVAWVASGAHSSRLSQALAAGFAALWIAAIALSGLWLALPWYLPIVYALLLATAVARSRHVRGRLPSRPAGARAVAGAVVAGVGLAVAAGVTTLALAGRRMPAEPVELAAPLRGGTYLVANGGSNALVSAHVATLADLPRFRPWRGQSHGVDFVRLTRGGLRARGVLPADPAAYAIFGDTIVAPCEGRVVVAVDGLADLPVPTRDRAHMAGNHVVLACGPVWVVLAHMSRASVCVGTGDAVALGQPLGRVGNSGNSDEPHLHVHAQRPGTERDPLSGDPLPVRLAGRYLVRNQRVKW